MKKSEKRARGEAKQAINRQVSIRSGLAAQKRDRELRAKKEAEAKQKAAEKEAQLQRLANQAHTTKVAFEKLGGAAKQTNSDLQGLMAVQA